MIFALTTVGVLAVNSREEDGTIMTAAISRDDLIKDFDGDKDDGECSQNGTSSHAEVQGRMAAIASDGRMEGIEARLEQRRDASSLAVASGGRSVLGSVEASLALKKDASNATNSTTAAPSTAAATTTTSTTTSVNKTE